MIGNDCLRIENHSSFSEEKLRSVLYLYSPLIGNDSLYVYQALSCERRDLLLVKDYLNSLRISIDTFEKALMHLSEFHLVHLYQSKTDYLLVIKEALSCAEFLHHSLFSTMLRKEIGESEFTRCQERFLNTIEWGDYRNISSKLPSGILTSWDTKWDEKKNTYLSEKEDSLFDIHDFVKGIGTLLFPYQERTPENLEAIKTCATLYHISPRKMRILLDNMRKRSEKFDKELLFRLASREKISFQEVKEGEYAVSPILFLMNKQGGRELTPTDKRILKSLVYEYHLQESVINVLIEYALKKHQNHLFANYIYPVASDMHRNNIRDPQAAKEFLNQSITNDKTVKDKIKKTSPANDVLPIYDDSKNPQVDFDELEAFFRKEK